MDSEKRGQEMSKKSSFRGPFNKQHGKSDQTMLKPEASTTMFIESKKVFVSCLQNFRTVC